MAEVKVLIKGVHSGIGPFKASSTVTLIRSDINIIVDTGSFLDEKRIIKALAEENLKPENIEAVVLTHLHIDHTRNTNIFSNAVLYVKHSHFPGSKWNINITCEAVELDNLEIAKGVKIILTPGHFPYHISVVVKTKDGIVVVAGDAVSTKEALGKIPYPQWNDVEYLKSQKKIIEISDWIIPGHGGIFKVNK